MGWKNKHGRHRRFDITEILKIKMSCERTEIQGSDTL